MPGLRHFECIFRYPRVRETIDPAIKNDWERTYGKRAPFGDLRRQWQLKHCRTLNPYGSEDCPYSLDQCTEAFARAVGVVTATELRSPGGYFGKVARSRAAERADAKPLARDLPHAPQGPGDTGDVPQDPGSRPWMRSPGGGFDSIGDLLRAIDPRSRENGAEDGGESEIGPPSPGNVVPMAPSRPKSRRNLGNNEGAP